MTAPQLLVSVRDAQEASDAIAGGADIIDVKEPKHGPMGMADAHTISTVIEEVNGRCPVTAALGHIEDQGTPPLPASLRYCKVAVSPTGDTWQRSLGRGCNRWGATRFIPVVFADAMPSDGPSIYEVLRWAVSYRAAGVMIDTSDKNGYGLLQYIKIDCLREIVQEAHTYGLMIGLAGSLTEIDLHAVSSLAPDVIGVRGAACAGSDRSDTISKSLVHQLTTCISK